MSRITMNCLCAAAIAVSTAAQAASVCGIDKQNADRDPRVELACLRALASQSSGLDELSDQSIDGEIDFRYGESARVGGLENAKIVALLTDEQERRHPPAGTRSTGGYGAYMLAGELPYALAEAKKKNIQTYDWERASFKRLPSAKSSASRYWSFNEDGSTLSEHQIDLTKGSHIVVFSAPGCGRCAAASNDIPKLPVLAKAFASKSLWVSFPDTNFSAEYYGTWQKKHSEYPIYIILDRTNWPKESLAATPYFVFMKDGVVKAEIIGWFGPKKAVEFEQAIAMIQN